jgi:hypothetical protein
VKLTRIRIVRRTGASARTAWALAIYPDELRRPHKIQEVTAAARQLIDRREAGQTAVIMALVLTVVAVLAGVAIDIGLVTWLTLSAQADAAAACVDAAEASYHGQDPYAAAAATLNANGQPEDHYSPYATSADGIVVRGFQPAPGVLSLPAGYRVALSWQQPIWFLQLVGIRTVPISGRARCIGPQARVVPIAVRETAVEHSLAGGNPEAYTILGNDPRWDLADIESGDNYRGAVIVHMRCKADGAVPVTNCPDVDVYSPLTEPPANPQTVKDLVADCFSGSGCGIIQPVGSHIPIVSGTSDRQLVQSFCDAGCAVGTLVVVMLFDGEVYDPDPTFGNWENVAITGYAVYRITDTSANAIEAELYSGPHATWADIDVETRPREISWTP